MLKAVLLAGFLAAVSCASAEWVELTERSGKVAPAMVQSFSTLAYSDVGKLCYPGSYSTAYTSEVSPNSLLTLDSYVGMMLGNRAKFRIDKFEYNRKDLTFRAYFVDKDGYGEYHLARIDSSSKKPVLTYQDCLMAP
jgi:hypothetical protein